MDRSDTQRPHAPDRDGGRRNARSRSHLALAAAVLSLFFPGSGHFLAGLWGRGLIWLVGWLYLAAVAGGAHRPLMLALGVVAAADVYLMLRLGPEQGRRQADGPRPGGEPR